MHMMDQAESLRAKLKNVNNAAKTKTIAVVSGKGGVGKSNCSLNFALGLSELGNKVLLFDLDIGMGNIDILMGMSSKHTIVDIFDSKLSIKEVIEEGPHGLSYIAGGAVLRNIFKMEEEKVLYLIKQFESLLGEYDYVIFDMSAGITEDSLQIALAVDDLFVVTTPEPTSMTDAYAVMKYFAQKDEQILIHLLVNQVRSVNQAKLTVQRLSKVAKQFLNRELFYLGDLPYDEAVSKAVNEQIPFLLHDPKSQVSRALKKVINRYRQNHFDQATVTSSFGFLQKLKQNFLGR